jgi:hypothetical protein
MSEPLPFASYHSSYVVPINIANVTQGTRIISMGGKKYKKTKRSGGKTMKRKKKSKKTMKRGGKKYRK